MTLISFIIAHKAIELGVLFGISEALSFIPQVQANGIFQAAFSWLKKNVPAAEAPKA